MSKAMAITDTDLEYLESLHGTLAGTFARMYAEGGHDGIPIVATEVGRALYVLVRATAARVVEVGTAIGYSALWMATALPADGSIDTIDPDIARTGRAREFWNEAGVGTKIVVHNGKGLEVLPTSEERPPLDALEAQRERRQFARASAGIARSDVDRRVWANPGAHGLLHRATT